MEQCYNKGCGQKYETVENKQDSCIYHSGVPVFHDAMKGWSCCKKRSTDFTEFLNTPGCTKGFHCNVKPEKPAPGPKDDVDNQEEEIIVKAPSPKPQSPITRPPTNEPLQPLNIETTSSLKQALNKQKESISLNGQENQDDVTIKRGTSCKHNACKAVYEDDNSDVESCNYHPGGPVFHEGMKYWSCCQRKTSEFDNFLNQEGCTTGNHLWKKSTSGQKMASCRYDFFQTPGFVTVNVYAKAANPELTRIEANQVRLSVHIVYEAGQSMFDMDLSLFGVIDIEKSKVKMTGTKVEINMKKADSYSWTKLEHKEPTTDKKQNDVDTS